MIELAHYIAQTDNDFADSEKQWIEKIAGEIGMKDFQPQGKAFNDIMGELQFSSVISKAAILLNMLNLVMIDYDYKLPEQKVIADIRKQWNITDEQFESISFWLRDKGYILKNN